MRSEWFELIIVYIPINFIGIQTISKTIAETCTYNASSTSESLFYFYIHVDKWMFISLQLCLFGGNFKMSRIFSADGLSSQGLL